MATKIMTCNEFWTKRGEYVAEQERDKEAKFEKQRKMIQELLEANIADGMEVLELYENLYAEILQELVEAGYDYASFTFGLGYVGYRIFLT